MPDELRPCPKCHGAPIVDHGDDGPWRVFCWWNKSCGHKTEWYETRQEAIDAWNHRAGEGEKG